MSERLMTPDDLVRVTRKKRYGKQAEWFKATFGIEVVTSGKGEIIMTWATFEALQAKKAGLSVDTSGARERPALRSVHRVA